MKVLQINAVNGIKSTGRTTIEIAEYLEDKGHDAYIAYSTGTPYYKGYKIGNVFEKKLNAFLNRILGKQEYYSSVSTRKLVKFIDEINPDIIHLRNLHASYINVKILFAYLIKKQKNVVITLHDCWFYTGKCTHYTIDNCFRWQESCGNCPRLKKDIPSYFFDKTSTMLNDKKSWFNSLENLAVIGVSDWITDQAKISILSNAKIVTRIYNWVDLDIFRPRMKTEIRRKYNLENKFLILGVASKWTHSKGLNHFITLSKKLKKDEIIILIGNINSEIKLPKNIINIKETHVLNELVDFYSTADVFLNLSKEETFGKTTAEALSCGTPIVVVNSTANPELVGEGCGYIINDLQPKTIIEKLNIIKNKNKSEYQNKCLEFSRKHFDKEKNIKQQIDIYKMLME